MEQKQLKYRLNQLLYEQKVADDNNDFKWLNEINKEIYKIRGILKLETQKEKERNRENRFAKKVEKIMEM